jgi:PAS domain S-box-containing protein
MISDSEGGTPGDQGCGGGPAASDGLSPDRFEAVLGSITDGVFTIDVDGRITCFNRAAETITGFQRDEAIGRRCHEVFRSNICKEACALRYTIETGRPVVNLMVHIITADGVEIPVSISTSPLRDKQGQLVGGVETFRDLRQVEHLRKQLESTYTFADIISKSDEMRQVLDLLPTVAKSESTVLILGESGTGKELVARAIHDLSGRARGPFVAINSAGIPETLIESELFGHEAGAFTGAVKARPGRFALASGGTLFLDEIGDLPLLLQSKLLRVLQERTYEPVGGTKTREADVRIVAATNRDLGAMVEQGQFRSDLFYRINVIPLTLPPLRERLQDVPLLVDHFVGRFSAVQDKQIIGVSPEALGLLMAHNYPGNVRELENIVEHGVVLCPGSMIKKEHLPRSLNPQPLPLLAAGSLEDFERQFILAALAQNDNNRLATAKQLGIHKTTLFRRIRKLGIALPATDGRSKVRSDG